MASLKNFLRDLSRHVGLTPDALYEKQRLLVRAGLLKIAKGRGPGSGVRLNSESLSTMLIALLASDTWAGAEDRVTRLLNAQVDGDLPPWLSRKTLKLALAEVLESLEVAEKLAGILVHRERHMVHFYWGQDVVSEALTRFAGGAPQSPPITTNASIRGDTIRAIAASLREWRHGKNAFFYNAEQTSIFDDDADLGRHDAGPPKPKKGKQ